MGDLGNEVLFVPTEDKGNHRPLADFPPDGWGDYFVSFPSSTKLKENSHQRIEELENEVKAMFKNFNNGPTLDHAALRLIDDLQRLGIAYRFEEEINESLRLIQDDDEVSDDIEIVSLCFSLLRQYGHNISSDVFKKFKHGEGKFKVELSSDTKGLLSLYEASFLGTHEDEILDEAFHFCKGHMEQYVSAQIDGNNLLATKIKRALETPFFRRFRRLEARHSIEIYRMDKASNPVLLELASLDFNLVQCLHQAEIKAISMWWQELGISKDLSFARQRLVEVYFWSLGVHWEPRYSKGRILLAKLVHLLAVTDDFFDAYGTIEELKLVTHMVQSWDFEAADQLSGSARVFVNFFKSVNDEIKGEMIKNGLLHRHYYVKECFKSYVEGYFMEAVWARDGYTPPLQEYLRSNSSGYPFLISVTPMLNGEEMPTDVLDWVLKFPTIIEAPSNIARLMDDLVTMKMDIALSWFLCVESLLNFSSSWLAERGSNSTQVFEQQRMHVASSVQCYAKEHGVTEQEACVELKKMVASAWKDMNKGLIDPCPFKKHLNMLGIDYSRVIELFYKYEDIFTNPSGEMRKIIAAVLVHPV